MEEKKSLFEVCCRFLEDRIEGMFRLCIAKHSNDYNLSCHDLLDLVPHLQHFVMIGLKLNSSSWSMVRGKDYMGNLSEIQERFVKSQYKGGKGCEEGKNKWINFYLKDAITYLKLLRMKF